MNAYRDGNGVLGCQNDGDGSTQLHRESAGWGVRSKAVTQYAHDVVSVSGETDDNPCTTENENPDRDVRVLACDGIGAPDVVYNGVWANCVGNIVGTMRKGGGASGHDLDERVQVLGVVVELLSVILHLGQTAGRSTSGIGLQTMDVDHHAICKLLVDDFVPRAGSDLNFAERCYRRRRSGIMVGLLLGRRDRCGALSVLVSGGKFFRKIRLCRLRQYKTSYHRACHRNGEQPRVQWS